MERSWAWKPLNETCLDALSVWTADVSHFQTVSAGIFRKFRLFLKPTSKTIGVRFLFLCHMWRTDSMLASAVFILLAPSAQQNNSGFR